MPLILIRILFLLAISVIFLSSNNAVFADEVQPNLGCNPDKDICRNDDKGNRYSCQPDFNDNGNPVINHNTNKQEYSCQKAGIGSTFGTIKPPAPIQSFIAKDPTGATAISKFLSNLIQLIYIFAAIALLFVLLWGAFDWITSEGDKEKVAAAQRKIINAVIGIMLFAVAFAILSVLGTFTGFEFFHIPGSVTNIGPAGPLGP